jgi:hypothetical protein
VNGAEFDLLDASALVAFSKKSGEGAHMYTYSLLEA